MMTYCVSLVEFYTIKEQMMAESNDANYTFLRVVSCKHYIYGITHHSIISSVEMSLECVSKEKDEQTRILFHKERRRSPDGKLRCKVGELLQNFCFMLSPHGFGEQVGYPWA